MVASATRSREGRCSWTGSRTPDRNRRRRAARELAAGAHAAARRASPSAQLKRAAAGPGRAGRDATARRGGSRSASPASPSGRRDLEELVTGPPVSAAFAPTGSRRRPRSALRRSTASRSRELERVRHRRAVSRVSASGSAARRPSTRCRTCWRACCAACTFPKQMHWDAMLDDGKGELLFGRPIRWMLFLYGGRVVPFTSRARPRAAEPARAGSRVRRRHLRPPVSRRRAAAPGRAVKVRTFEEYRARLLEHFVVLDREERRERIARDLEVQAAQRLGGRVQPRRCAAIRPARRGAGSGRVSRRSSPARSRRSSSSCRKKC